MPDARTAHSKTDHIIDYSEYFSKSLTHLYPSHTMAHVPRVYVFCCIDEYFTCAMKVFGAAKVRIVGVCLGVAGTIHWRIPIHEYGDVDPYHIHSFHSF